jgi:hypothetical protein
MDNFFPKWLDHYFRRHPRMLIACCGVLFAVALYLLVSQFDQPTVLYQGF